jgi:DMSO/TMAO reductase YedYZ molybdopterin-dependent catalytic subunit
MDEATDGISLEELQLATRNHGMPLEALRSPLTPLGLHYLLIHYDIPAADDTTWRLRVVGHVANPLELSMDELRALPKVTIPVTMECAGNGRTAFDPRPVSQPWILEAVGTGAWTGTSLGAVLERAEPREGAVEVVFTGADRGLEDDVPQQYERSLSLQDAMGEDVLLSYELNGEPLPPQHGFPLRLTVPGWYGMTHVKWLREMTVVTEPFQGYQQVRGYRYRQGPDEPGTPVSRIQPRSLMVPPGIPEFFSRRRHVPAGPCRIEGRAWSGWAPIDRVQVSDDRGTTWGDADLDEPVGRWAWRGWSFTWNPPGLGEYELWSRARDAAGNEQPLEPPWNLGGYGNNAVHRVPVVVDGGA